MFVTAEYLSFDKVYMALIFIHTLSKISMTATAEISGIQIKTQPDFVFYYWDPGI